MRHLALVVLAACAARPAAPLPLARTASIAAGAEQVDEIDEIVELGDAVYAFSARGVAIARGGSVVASAPPPVPGAWRSAAVIAALDGESRWVVAAAADGSLWHVRASAELERIDGRLGLTAVEAIASAGTTTAFALSDGLAISDGVHIDRYPVRGAIAVAAGRVAVGTARGVELWELARGQRRTFAIPHGRPAFLDADRATSRLVVSTGEVLYVEAGRGELRRIPAPAPLRAIAAGARLWVAGASALYLLDGDRLVRTAAPAAPQLFGSPGGDLWLAGAALDRYAPAAGAAAAAAAWQATIAPIFQRVCSHCHLPDGPAGIDLSTPAAWSADRFEIARRVLATRTMPPAGTEISDADRAALAAYLR